MATAAQVKAIWDKYHGAVKAPAATTPQALAPDPILQRGLIGAGRRRDTTIDALGTAEKGVQTEYGGFTTGSDGVRSIDPGNPQSRAALLQQEWQNKRNERYQNVGNNLYSSSYSQGRAGDDANETGAFGQLLKEKTGLLNGFVTDKLAALGKYSDDEEGLLYDATTRLSSAPNDSTVSDRTVGVNPDGSAITTGQKGLNSKGQPYIVYFNKKGQAYHVYGDGHLVRMPKEDKKKVK